MLWGCYLLHCSVGAAILLHGDSVSSDGLACKAAVKIKPEASRASKVFIMCPVCSVLIQWDHYLLEVQAMQLLSVNN